MSYSFGKSHRYIPLGGGALKPAALTGLTALLCGFTFFLLAACAEPVPLYGTWADNHGDSISFFDDGTFSATVVNEDKDKVYFSGTYTVLLNALSLQNAEDNRQIVTEWDIRGNILTLNWATEEGIIPLTLFKIAN
jgi:hypothetical protein